MKLLLTLFSLVAITVISALPAIAQTETYLLENGMTVILKENHGSPMVASVVFVKSGSKYEGKFENGITHFLEHLLFDGTTHLDREQLDKSITDLGGYINAFTQKDLTAYLILLPKQYIDYGMTVQADMLFNSVFPEKELGKERKVVIEEINRDADGPSAPADEFFSEKAYGDTEYGRPVLGYRAFIENIPREAVIEYWKKYYRPSNMITLIIGDFDSPQMKTTVQQVFGTITDPDTASSRPAAATQLLTGHQRFDTISTVASTFINFSVAGPGYGTASYLPFDLLTRYLNLDEISPLKKALMGDQPLATEATISLGTYDGFSRMDITVVTDKPEKRDSIVNTVVRILKETSKNRASDDALQGIKTSVKTEDIYNAEKLHYYGFMIAPLLMTAGWDFVQHYPELLEQVTWQQAQEAARIWLDTPSYVVTVVRPNTDSSKTPYRAQGLSTEEVTAHFRGTTFQPLDLSGTVLNFPSTDAVQMQIADRAVYHREILDNGLTVIVKSSSDSRVFAINALGKNRTASEPEGKAGITDFVNRCLEKGTTSRTASALSQDLARIGANATLYDNPWIPYDDRYTVPMFSFVKFETIDDFAKDGFLLFSDMLKNPSFDSIEVEKVRQGMLGVLMREATSPGTVAKNLFYKALFEGKAYAKPIMGTAESIGGMTLQDLRNYHGKFYAPDNLILAIATSRDTAEVMAWVKEQFGGMAKSNLAAEAQPPDVVVANKQQHQELQKEQIAIYLGSSLPKASDPMATPLDLAFGILSDRLYSNLREQKGLAYSVGAGAFLDKNFGWFYCSMGTSVDKYKQAYDGLLLELDKLRLDGPTDAELKRARNQVWGRLMSAKLSRINQAYYLAVNEYLGRTPNYDSTYLRSLEKVTLTDVTNALSKYVRTDALVLTTAGKRGGE